MTVSIFNSHVQNHSLPIIVFFPSEIFLLKQPGRLRSSNSLNAYYVQPFARTSAYLNSYVPSTLHFELTPRRYHELTISILFAVCI